MADIYCRLLLTAVVLGASLVPATANFNLYLTQAEVRRILGMSQNYYNKNKLIQKTQNIY